MKGFQDQLSCDHTSSIASCLERHFPGEGRPALVREALLWACDEFAASGLADRKFEIELMDDSDDKFWSCISEALVYKRLRDKVVTSRSNVGVGPDFLLQVGQKRVWVEVICPAPTGVPADWLDIQIGQVTSMPHEAILLRWTAAIKEKTDKLVGSFDGRVRGYLEKGIVAPEDIYVIAVNGCRLRHGPFSALLGISQFPYAAEAVFPIGPYQVRVDCDMLEPIVASHEQRFSIKKPKGALVPTYAFLDPRFKPVSAVWAIDFNGCGVIGNSEPSALIHNPYANNQLPQQVLQVDEEYMATPLNDSELLMQRVGSSERP